MKSGRQRRSVRLTGERRKSPSIGVAAALVILVLASAFIWLMAARVLVADVRVRDAAPMPPLQIHAPPPLQAHAPPYDESDLEELMLPADLGISSPNAVLIDAESGLVLFYKNGTERIYPASMVKMMTALVAIERIGDLDEQVLMREEIFPAIAAANASVAGFLPGERARAVDLLYGVLLSSGADSSVGLAEHLAGSEHAFAGLMNGRARQIGMTGTNFTNSTGLHDENQYSTAMDMAVLLRYALANSTFRSIITSASHLTAPTSLRPEGIALHSTLFARLYSPEFDGGVILGGRTGWTGPAGQCLASFASIGGREYILVTAGAMHEYHGQTLHFDDAFIVYAALAGE